MTDRDALIARIDRAAEAGLIGEVDKNIRITNVKHAQSDTELQLIARDLDQLESTIHPAEANAWAGPASASPIPIGVTPPPPPEGALPVSAPQAGKVVGRTIGCAVLTIFLVASLVIGVVMFSVIRGATWSSSGQTAEVEAVGPAFSLDKPGIRDFLDQYETEFGTTEVAEMVMYDDYAVVHVPVEGKARASMWLFRDGQWQQTGKAQATRPGLTPVDLNDLKLKALMRNIGRAQAELGVEDISSTYVVLAHDLETEPPRVDIYVSNDFNESGYLATRLDGTVIGAHPYQ